MEVKTIPVGFLATNCYILINNGQCLVIDPGDDGQRILKFIDNHGLTLAGILITHNHPDHIGGLTELNYNRKVDVYQASNLVAGPHQIANFIFEVINTPGHTDDSVTFYFKDDKLMFVGDFLFNGSIGRCDFHNSSVQDMKKSLASIKKYDDNITIYPGHGDSSTLGFEKQYNPYLKGF